jgi:hypothetical protein
MKRSYGLLKNLSVTVLALMLFMFSTFSWYSFKTPSTINIMIDDPTTDIIVEKFDESTGTYELVESTENSYLVDIPPITFYEWLGSLVSTFGENLQYRIKITSNFRSNDFAYKPLFFVDATLLVSSDVEELRNIKILKAEYRVSTPTESLANFQNDFPDTGFFEIYPTSVPANTPVSTPVTEVVYNNYLLFPDANFPAVVEEVTLSGVDRFQTIFYLKISPDSDAVADIIDLLTELSTIPEADNTLGLSFGFRSVPYYVPPTSSPVPTP